LGDRPLAEFIFDAEKWQCASCGAIFQAEQMPLRAEDSMSVRVPQMLQGGLDTAESDKLLAAQLREFAAAQLGKNHWCCILATFGWLQKCLMLLHHYTIIDFQQAELQEASVAVARWFQEFAPHNSEQRLATLSLSVRLASYFGSSLVDWGYDPKDPLNDGCGAKRQVVIRNAITSVAEPEFEDMGVGVQSKIEYDVDNKCVRRYFGKWF